MAATTLDSVRVAQTSGLHLAQKGNRYWACCPLHGEKTPSLCFFPDGKWHCFGCGKHGDAADLYAALRGVPLGEALQAVNGGTYRPKLKDGITAAELKRRIDGWKGRLWAIACMLLHRANSIIDDPATSEDALWNAVDLKAKAIDFLNALECAQPAELVRWYLDRKNRQEGHDDGLQYRDSGI